MKTAVFFRYILFSLPVLGLLSSCGDPVILDVDLKDFDKMANKLVIDARIDDDSTRPDTVIVRRLGSPYEGKPGAGIEGANVTIFDAKEQATTAFSPVAGKPGYYVAPASFVGVVDDRLYTCRVVVSGTTYTASSVMGVLSKDPVDNGLDSLGVTYDKDKKGYLLQLYASVPKFEDYPVYYVFRFYRNDSLTNRATGDRPTIVPTATNEILDDSFKAIELPDVYRRGSKGRMEFFGVTRDCHRYWNELGSQINTDGGLFGTPPANVKGNFDNGALGYFQCASFYYLEKTNIGN